MAMSGEVKSIGLLMLVLFIIGIITAVTYIGFGYLKETACEQATDDAYWNNSVCQISESDATALTVTAVTKVGIVEGVVEVVLGLLTLVVVVSLFAIVIKSARGFTGGNNF